MSEHSGQDRGTLRVTIKQAAERLGITEAAIRKRIQRGSVRAEEIQRRDVIISQLTQANAALAARVPELEAAQEPSEATQEPAETAARAREP